MPFSSRNWNRNQKLEKEGVTKYLLCSLCASTLFSPWYQPLERGKHKLRKQDMHVAGKEEDGLTDKEFPIDFAKEECIGRSTIVSAMKGNTRGHGRYPFLCAL